MVKIVKAPNSVLSEIAKPVGKVDKEILDLIEQMKQALLEAKDPEGVGLAAPQIGKSLQIFITKPSPKSPIFTFINPSVIEARNDGRGTEGKARVRLLDRRGRPPSSARSDPKLVEGERGHRMGVKPGRTPSAPTKLEGCLSLQDIWGTVGRKPQVFLSYLDEKGREHKRLFKGFQAIIIQHEMDHLKGVLFPKRVLEQKGTLYKSHKTEKGEIEFEELQI